MVDTVKVKVSSLQSLHSTYDFALASEGSHNRLHYFFLISAQWKNINMLLFSRPKLSLTTLTLIQIVNSVGPVSWSSQR